MCYCMCSDVMCTLRGMHMQASQLPYVYVAHQKLLMDVLFVQAKGYLSKLTASHFSTLNTKIAKTKCAEKDSHCHAQMRTRPIAMRT